MPKGYLEHQKVDLIVREHPKKIAYIYFKFEKISFTDDILKEVGIHPKYIIDKPSSNREMAINFYMDRLKELKMTKEDEYLKIFRTKEKIKKTKSKRIINHTEINLTRNFVLANKNR